MRRFNPLILFIALVTLFLPACGNSDEDYLYSSSKEASLEYLIQHSEYKILAIGNSFLEDATRHLPRLMKEQKESTILFCRLHRNSSSLKDHWENHLTKERCYELYYICNGSWYRAEDVNIDDALELADWDVVTHQQLSDYSGLPESYAPYLQDLIGLARQGGKNTKTAWHQTWSFSSNATITAFANYGYDPDKMMDAINKACETYCENFDITIPSGTLIEELRKSPYNTSNDLTLDGRHLDHGLPCYALSCLWHEELITPITGKSSLGSKFRPSLGRIKVTDESAEYAFSLINSLTNENYKEK